MNARSTLALAVAASFASWPAGAQEAGRTAPATRSTPAMEEVVAVTAARRREEAVQDVPIPISIVDGGLVTDSGSFNVNRVKELIPTVQLYSSNPRNTGVNIRGLGAQFGLTNAGLEPRVGFRGDRVLHRRA